MLKTYLTRNWSNCCEISIYGLFVALIQDVKGMCCLLDAADAKNPRVSLKLGLDQRMLVEKLPKDEL